MILRMRDGLPIHDNKKQNHQIVYDMFTYVYPMIKYFNDSYMKKSEIIIHATTILIWFEVSYGLVTDYSPKDKFVNYL
jgi:hypothetical protein